MPQDSSKSYTNSGGEGGFSDGSEKWRNRDLRDDLNNEKITWASITPTSTNKEHRIPVQWKGSAKSRGKGGETTESEVVGESQPAF